MGRSRIDIEDCMNTLTVTKVPVRFGAFTALREHTRLTVYAGRDALELGVADALLVNAKLAVTLAADRLADGDVAGQGRLLATDLETSGTALSHRLTSVGPLDITFWLHFPKGQGDDDALRLIAYRNGRLTVERIGDAGEVTEELEAE